MPDYAWEIGFWASFVCTFIFSTLIGRKVYKAGVEHFSSRILVLSGMTNATLCSLLFLLQGIYGLHQVILSASSGIGQLLVSLVFLIVPGRIAWNYFRVPKKLIARFDLTTHCVDTFTTHVVSLCRTMAISPPTLLSSDLVDSPFIFGRRSNKAIMAVPKSWQQIDDDRQNIQLLHELAHIRNRDVGFLAWSNACIQDLRLLLILLPVSVLYCYILDYNHLAPSICLYLACSLILFMMLKYVVRKREALADMTSAMLVESGKVKDVISQQGMYFVGTHVNAKQPVKPGLTDKIQRWLTDKALFSQKQKLWKLPLRTFNFFHSLHPSKSDRLRTVSFTKTTDVPNLSLGDSFWAGVALGLTGVIIGLGGYWYADTFFQQPQEEVDALRLSYQIYGLAAPIAIGYLAIFLALPAWSSLRQLSLTKRFFLSQMARYGITFAGASLVCPIVLTMGTGNNLMQVLLAFCFLWCVFIILFGFAVNTIITSLWVTLRYLQSSHVAEIRKAIWAFGLFVIIVFGLILAGAKLINTGMIFHGVNIVVSTIAGGALVSLAVRGSRFSETELYIILCSPFFIYRLEGKWFNSLVWIIHSFYITALLMIFVLLICSVNYFVLGIVFQNLDSTLGVFIAGGVCCSIMILLERNGLGRIGERKRHKIYSLLYCLKLLSRPLDTNTQKKINRAALSYDLPENNSDSKVLNLTVLDVYELVALISDDPTQADMLDRVSSWILDCQTQGGFGVWPGSSSRLCSTYQAVSILRDVNLLEQCKVYQHVSWIKTLQQSDGLFKGPWSNRSALEDTFFAVESLRILGSSVDCSKAPTCQEWCNRILSDQGLKNNKPTVVYHCLGILKALDAVDENISRLMFDWLSITIDELLLTNIALNYENVCLTVMIYHLLNVNSQTYLPKEKLALLTQRIQTALDAELTDIPV
jgi:hypothetical protein